MGVLVWVASFPRSGNTYLRILLHRLYGVPTSTVYDVDGVAERLGADLVGFTPRPAPLAAMRAAPEVHFIKTHRQRDADVDPGDAAICLVRDGRDALVSWARQAAEADPTRYESHLHAMITRAGSTGTGSWGSNVLSWLRPAFPHRPVLAYTDLTTRPAALADVMSIVAPQLSARPGASAPRFDELRAVDDRFFRRGLPGSHRDELPAHLADLFWSRPDNAAAMRLLGFRR